MTDTSLVKDILRFYGRRKSKPLTDTRERVLKDVFDKYGIKVEQNVPNLNPSSLFAFPVKEVWFEVGFGGGEHLVHQALNNPDVGLIGCEPFINGVASLASLIEEHKVKNIMIWSDDARLLLNNLIPHSLSKFFLLHPDPWPKTRHNKRRFVQTEILDQLSGLLVDGAEFRTATDHEDLAIWMKEKLDENSHFKCKSLEAPSDWIDTRYCNKGKKEGREPAYFNYTNQLSK